MVASKQKTVSSSSIILIIAQLLNEYAHMQIFAFAYFHEISMNGLFWSMLSILFRMSELSIFTT